AGVGAFTEGYKSYECGARGWKLAGAIGRGAIAGLGGALAGLGTALFTENPFWGGATSSATYDLINGGLGGGFTWSKTGEDALFGGVFGWAGGSLVGPVRGGWNFNPW